MKYAKLLPFIAFALLAQESCKQPNNSDVSFDSNIANAVNGANLSDKELTDICSLHSFKIFIANAEAPSIVEWQSDDDKADMALAEQKSKSDFEKVIKENMDSFIDAHRTNNPERCNPSQKTKTTILTVFDGFGAGNSEIKLYEGSFQDNKWTLVEGQSYGFERDGNNARVVKKSGAFELNMATDVLVILDEFLDEIVKDYQQIEFFVSGHGAHAIVNASASMDLFAEFKIEGRSSLLLLDTVGPNGPIYSDLYTPVWLKTTAAALCNKGGNAAKSSETCENLRSDVATQVGFSGEPERTSGENGRTNGDPGGRTNGDGGHTSGKVYSSVKPTIDVNQPVSATNAEGIARAGQAASYNLLGHGVVRFDLKERFRNAKVPSLVVLNSCFQSEDIKKVLPKGFFVHFNPYPIYTWLVDFGSLNDFGWRALPFLLSKPEGGTVRNMLAKGISTKRLLDPQKGNIPKQCVRGRYCELQTVLSE